MYRCVAEVCGKGFPRRVNFCPFCGTRQAAGGGRWADAGGSVQDGPRHGNAALEAGAAGHAAVAANSAQGASQARAMEQAQADERARGGEQARADQQVRAEDRTRTGQPARAAERAGADEKSGAGEPALADEKARADAARAEALAQVRDTSGVANGAASRQPPEQLSPEQRSALERLNALRGGAAPAASASSSAPASRPGQPGNPPQPARPPLRKPISKGTWVSVAIVLGLIWFLARPSDPSKKLQARVDQAVAQAQDCKIDAARNAYTSLKADKAGAEQLKHLQAVINSNAKACDAKRHRVKAWSDLRPQLESALQNGSIDLADRRLAAFVKTWGADDETREFDGRIDVRKGERLLNEADACIKRSDRACAETKLQAAEKLQRGELKTRIELLREALSDLLKRTVLVQHGTFQ
jgi:hypothetical protein